MKRHLIIYSLLFFLFCVLSCRNKQAVATEESSAHDLEQIKDSGELVVLTLYSSTSYFIYRGQDMGFQYELSEQFAKSLGVKLQNRSSQKRTGTHPKVTKWRRRYYRIQYSDY